MTMLDTLRRRRPEVRVESTVWWAVWMTDGESHRAEFDCPAKANAYLTAHDLTDAWIEMEMVDG